MLKSRASWKGLDRKYLLSSDPYKNITLFFDLQTWMLHGH